MTFDVISYYVLTELDMAMRYEKGSRIILSKIILIEASLNKAPELIVGHLEMNFSTLIKCFCIHNILTFQKL